MLFLHHHRRAWIVRDVKVKLAYIALDSTLRGRRQARVLTKRRPTSSQMESPSQLDASASAALRCSSRQASLVRKPAASTALPSNLSSSYTVFFELDQDRLVTEAEFDSLSSPALRRAATTGALVVPLAVTRFCLARIGSELRQPLVQRQWRAGPLGDLQRGAPGLHGASAGADCA